jgi:polyphosphate kinase
MIKVKEKTKELEVESKFFNRELSWLEFNDRVLEEAQDTSNPLLERLKFIAIVSSNLDEFFMVRVGSLWDQVLAGFRREDSSGLTPKAQLNKISARTHTMVYNQYNCYNRSLIPCLKKERIVLTKGDKLTEFQQKYLENYFNKEVFPVITPMVVDKSRPFPLIFNKSLNIALLIKNRNNNEEDIFATVQVPSVIQRLVELPSEENEKKFILLEDILKIFINNIFNGHEIITMGCYRLTRNADLSIDEEGAEDLLEAIEQSIKLRKWGAGIRLEVEKGMDKKLINILKEEMEVKDDWVFSISGPLDLTVLMKMSFMKGYNHLKHEAIPTLTYKKWIDEDDLFKVIAKRDILLHHPYEPYEPVVEFVRQAAEDPDVLAIKQTLYRVSGKSPIVEALVKAAENGKQVTVLVELKARFDEENNINWAKRLEQAGCHVIYGLVGLKIHGKILLVVRREEDGIKRYVHMSTGNYNDVTAKIYTDIGLFTANPYFGADASLLFNMLSGYSQITNMYKIDIAPISLRDRFLFMISREKEHARNGKKAKIIVKVNSLVDEKIIEALYEASASGVEIELIVRGICCLKPGVKDLSERIRVTSIVGRYLEHSRIYYFYNDGDEEIYLSSADWMQRNLDRRVEILFPVEDKICKDRIKDILQIQIKDTVKARFLKEDGTYSKIDKRGKEQFDSQRHFYNDAVKQYKDKKKQDIIEEFIPI